MNYQEFVALVGEHQMQHATDEEEVRILPVTKNNGICLNGLVIQGRDEKIAPYLYLEPYYQRYEEGEELDSILQEILEEYQRLKNNQMVPEVDLTYPNVKEKIIYRLVNYKKNRKILQEMPHIRFLDLAITFHYMVRCSEDGIETIRITKEYQERWKLSNEELMRIAEQNTEHYFPKRIIPMAEMIHTILERSNCAKHEMEDIMTETGTGSNLYVMSNQMGVYGATTLLYQNAVADFAKSIQSDLYLLPSSVHELILVPKQHIEKESLQEMVEEVNATQVLPSEILSGEVYFYSREENRFVS